MKVSEFKKLISEIDSAYDNCDVYIYERHGYCGLSYPIFKTSVEKTYTHNRKAPFKALQIQFKWEYKNK